MYIPPQENTIFIAIPAFNENKRLEETISNVISMAKYPELLSFGVTHHHSDKLPERIADSRVRAVQVVHPAGLGVGMSRLLAQSMYMGEKYVLNMDAHCLMAPYWDEDLISIYEDIKEKEKTKVVISQPPLNWWTDEHGNLRGYPEGGKYRDNLPLIGAPQQYLVDSSYLDVAFPEIDDDSPVKTKHDYNQKYSVGPYMSCSFVFSEAKYFQDIPHSPYLYYKGEQYLLAMRSWTRGYRFFTINTPIIWALDKHQDRQMDMRDRHYTDAVDLQANSMPILEEVKHYNHSEGGKDALKYFWGKKFGFYGAPDIDSWKEYMDYIGYTELLEGR